MVRFAANLSFLFTEVSFPERFKQAAAAGFKGVEFLFPYAFEPSEIVTLTRDAAVTLALFNLPPGDWDAGDRGLSAVPGRQAEFQASVNVALRYAEATGLKQLHIMAGIVSDQERSSAEAVYVENLAFAAKRLAEAGITALIEPINSKDMSGYFLNHVEEALRVMDQVDAPNLKLQLDCYHRARMSGDVLSAIHDNFDKIAHIQIAGLPSRNEPIRGTVDYPKVFDTLESLDYQGWVGCEYHPHGGTLEGLGWMAR